MRWITAVFILIAVGGFVIKANQIITKWGAQEISNAQTPEKIKADIEQHKKICIKIKTLLKKEKTKQETKSIRNNIQRLLFQYENQIAQTETALKRKNLEQAVTALAQAEETLGDLIITFNHLRHMSPPKESGDIKMAESPGNQPGDFFIAAIAFFYFL